MSRVCLIASLVLLGATLPAVAQGWVEVDGRWQSYRVTRMEYSTLIVKRVTP